MPAKHARLLYTCRRHLSTGFLRFFEILRMTSCFLPFSRVFAFSCAVFLCVVLKNAVHRGLHTCAKRGLRALGTLFESALTGYHSMILVTTPEPTVRPPSRIAKRSFSSMAIGVISVHSMSTLSPGMTISTPSGSLMLPVTSVVRK